METVKKLLALSRPRFWTYLAGPFLLGVVWSGQSLGFLQTLSSSLEFWLLFLYFLIPANVFLYGVNDISDMDFDSKNIKKKGKEITLNKSDERLKLSIFSSGLVGYLILFLTNQPLEVYLVFTIFIFLSVFYSLEPIRFKRRVVLDFASNLLYILPGVIGYMAFLENTSLPPIEIMLAAFFWSWAMHLFSAIPDISVDMKHKIKTTAVWLGRENSLLLVLILWFTSLAIIVFAKASIVVVLFGSIYPIIPFLRLLGDKRNDVSTYWLFPKINAIFGFVLFLFGVLRYYA